MAGVRIVRSHTRMTTMRVLNRILPVMESLNVAVDSREVWVVAESVVDVF